MMQARSTTFLAAAALLAVSTPALAAEDHPLPPPPAAGHNAVGAPDAGDRRPVAEPVSVSDADLRPEWREREQPIMRYAMPQQPAPRFTYSAEQRAAWIDECHSNQMPRDRRSATLIGGLLGAVAGGVAGNRIADGSRLAGTLIGSGVGAGAGAAIGSAIDRGNDRERQDRAFAFCEDYLSRYEAGAMIQPAYGYTYGYPAGYAMAIPVMMVAMPMAGQRSVQREEIVEEWVEEVPPTRVYQVPAAAPAAVRTPAAVKRVPLKRIPAK